MLRIGRNKIVKLVIKGLCISLPIQELDKQPLRDVKFGERLKDCNAIKYSSNERKFIQ